MDVRETLSSPTIFPLGLGGIQRTLEALSRSCPPTGSAVFVPAGSPAKGSDAAAPYRSSAVRRVLLAGRPRLRRRSMMRSEASGAQVVLSVRRIPLHFLGPRITAPRHPIPFGGARVRSTGCRWPQERIPDAPATSRATRRSVMCSEFIARVLRTAVPSSVPVSFFTPAQYPTLSAPTGSGRHPRTSRDRRSPARRMCLSRLSRQGSDVLNPRYGEGKGVRPHAVLMIVGGGHI